MKTIWKVLVGLALVVPMVAYVAGSLVASAADDPAPRQTIQIQQPGPTPTPKPRPTRTTQSPQPPVESDDVEVITPEYDDFDDHDDHGDDDGGDHGDDHGGGDDHSGS